MDSKDWCVTIIDRNYPPSLGINGESACDLAYYLEKEHGIKPIIVHVDCEYPGGGEARQPVGEIHKVPMVYNGKNKVLRLLGSLVEGYLLARKAKKKGRGIIFSMTNPPLLAFWVSKIFKKNKVGYGLWSMDLYPEAFVSAGLINRQNFFYRYIKKSLKTNPPQFLISLGPKQAEFIKQDLNMNCTTLILPCGVFLANKDSGKPDWRKNDNKVYFGYVGNLGEAHSLDFVEKVIKELDKEKHHFILSTYGSKSTALLARVKGNPAVTIVNAINRTQLSYIDVHLVSLLPEWTHVCVPSKAVSAVCSGSTILFYGSKNSDSWELLKEAAWLIPDGLDLESTIRNFASTISLADIQKKRKNATEISKGLQNLINNSYERIAELIKNYSVGSTET